MVLLGINTGLGNYDITCLPSKAMDLKEEMARFSAAKDQHGRRCPLWPETITAIREPNDQRPKPKKHEHEAVVHHKVRPAVGHKDRERTDEKGRVRKNADDPMCKNCIS